MSTSVASGTSGIASMSCSMPRHGNSPPWYSTTFSDGSSPRCSWKRRSRGEGGVKRNEQFITTSGRWTGQRLPMTSAYASLTVTTRDDRFAQPRSRRPRNQRAGRPIRARLRALR